MFCRRLIHSLCLLPLLAVAAAAQLAPATVPVALPRGGVGLLVTQLAPVGSSTTSVLLTPGSHTAGGAPSASAEGIKPVLEGPQRFFTRWTDALGGTHSLLTTEELNETADEHALRHVLVLAPLLAQFPPVGPGADTPSLPAEGTQTHKTNWIDIDGLSHEVVTVRRSGESTDNWTKRHIDGVNALLKHCPAPPPPPPAPPEPPK